MQFIVEHITINKCYVINAEDESSAWDYFLDYKLPLKDMAEDYTITAKASL